MLPFCSQWPECMNHYCLVIQSSDPFPVRSYPLLSWGGTLQTQLSTYAYTPIMYM
jgi:hypothetical protein